MLKDTFCFIFAILAVIPASTALTYHGYSSTVSCSGSYFACNDGGAVCCTMPTGYAYSAQFFNLPAVLERGARARSLNWFHSAGRRSIPARAEEKACVPPSAFGYADENGVERVIKVASDEEAEEISSWYTKKDFEQLAKFASYEG
ncbi:hypothetical protein ONZ45_g13549 [Pleurotus djamor]|nr:hypothetical protein ONZ45_g13549 [Pleurotus djamor]